MKTIVFLALVGFVAAQIQVQIPVQRPQAPPQHFPNFQQAPRVPIQPRATWRDPVQDSRCVGVDDPEGFPVFLPGNAQWDFFKCWGDLAWPFNCPLSTVWDTSRNVCVFSFQLPARFRPFNEDGEDNE